MDFVKLKIESNNRVHNRHLLHEVFK